MAIVISSFTPATGSTAGGTKVVITGTGLDTVDIVEFGTHEGSIDTTAVNTATSLTVLAPPIANADAGAVKILLASSADGTDVLSSTSFTYTSVSTPVLATNTAKKWKWQVSADAGATWITVRGVTNFQPLVDLTTVDDSDYDSDEYGSDTPTQKKWSLVSTLDRKTAAGYVEDPGQGVLRAAFNSTVAGNLVLSRWFDRNGGDEAYSGTGIVKWTEKGGGTADKSTVDVTVMGRGDRTTISNPA